MSLTLRVEFTCGDSIEKAAAEALAFCIKFGVSVIFNFNGVECLVLSTMEIKDIIYFYRSELIYL